MKSIKYSVYFLIFFLIFYLEPIYFFDIKFAVIWKFVFFIILLLNIFLIRTNVDYYTKKFLNLGYFLTFKGLVNFSSITYFTANTYLLLKSLNLPLFLHYLLKKKYHLRSW